MYWAVEKSLREQPQVDWCPLYMVSWLFVKVVLAVPALVVLELHVPVAYLLSLLPCEVVVHGWQRDLLNLCGAHCLQL